MQGSPPRTFGSETTRLSSRLYALSVMVPIVSTRPRLHQHRPGSEGRAGNVRRAGGHQVNLQSHDAGRRCHDRERFAPCSNSQAKRRRETYQLRQLLHQSSARSRSTQIGHSVRRWLSETQCSLTFATCPIYPVVFLAPPAPPPVPIGRAVL